MPYDLHIGIDYSGRETPTSRTPALQVYAAFDTEEPRRILSPASTDKIYKNWCRKEIAEWLIEQARKNIAFIAGIDHGFSFRNRMSPTSTSMDYRDMNSLDTFGSFFVKNFRDKSLDNLQGLLDGHWKAPELQSLQSKVATFSPDQKSTVQELVETMLTHAMHDLLFAFQDSHDCDSGIEIMVDNEPVAALSDGLHGEIFGEDGWIVRFSKHPAEAEIARSRWAEEEIDQIIRKLDNPPKE